MANRKVTDLPEKTVLDSDDYVYLVDREDTTESAQGTSKKTKISSVSAMSEEYTNTRADQARDEAKTYADSLVVGLWDDRGNYDASSNVFPSTGGSGASGAILRGDTWTISVIGVLGSKNVNVGDVIRALTDNPMQNSSNWNILELNFGFDVENRANKQNSLAVDGGGVKYPTVDAVNAALTTKQDTLVSGTNIKTINGNSILGSGDLSIAKYRTDFHTLGNRYAAMNIDTWYSSGVDAGLILDSLSGVSVGSEASLAAAMAIKWVTPITIARRNSKLSNFYIRITSANFTLLRVVIFMAQGVNGNVSKSNAQVIHDETFTINANITQIKRTTFTNDVVIPEGYDLCYLLCRKDGASGGTLSNFVISGELLEQ